MAKKEDFIVPLILVWVLVLALARATRFIVFLILESLFLFVAYRMIKNDITKNSPRLAKPYFIALGAVTALVVASYFIPI